MVKIFKLNKTGTLGVVVNKQMKAAGYVQGMVTTWEAVTGGFLLRLNPSSPLPLPELQEGVKDSHNEAQEEQHEVEVESIENECI